MCTMMRKNISDNTLASGSGVTYEKCYMYYVVKGISQKFSIRGKWKLVHFPGSICFQHIYA